ncbi:MAG: type-F conjugative transfer system protein TraW [Pseudomonadota bacterium]
MIARLTRWWWLAAWTVVQGAYAESLGVIGPVYPIAEEDFLIMIQRRLQEKDASGELARLRSQAVERGRQAVLQPPPLPLQVAQAPRTYRYDPTYVLDRNILDASGRLLFPAGTRTNPLDVVPLTRRLLFFDARDTRQVALAANLIKQYAGAVKPVLTGGSYLDLMRRWRMPVYYDQRGLLVRRLSIGRVPALVSQEGKLLRIDEIVPPAGPGGREETP